MSQIFTLALPSKGALSEGSLQLLKSCGLKVWKPNPRQYTGKIPAITHLDVMFQRVKDIVYKVGDGTAHLGITGLDVVYEYADENVMVIHPDLAFGHCQLLVAVPESWVDVDNMADLTDVAADIRNRQNRNLRVATTYTRSARQFLHESGIHHFTLVKADGAIEAAPTLGYADAVVDITQTGTTLRENRLKTLDDSVILSSQACLVVNREAFVHSKALRQIVRILLEHIDASLVGKRYVQLSANVTGQSEDEVARLICEHPVTCGLQGPSIARVYNSDERDWYAVTVVIDKKNMLTAVDHLRSIGGQQATVRPVEFVFLQQSPTYAELMTRLQLD